jgi:ATP-dependent HslUV protease, peptidase subunit HslV
MLVRQPIRSTTILSIRRQGRVVMAGDGQVTQGDEILKATARKLRRVYNDQVLVGFAGSTADALALLTRFEAKLEQHHGNLPRSVVELGKDWRTDRVLRYLQAFLLVADARDTFMVSGGGDVVEPEEGIAAIGSGGPIAKAAALALIRNTRMDARSIAEQAMTIASETCIYTNRVITYDELAAPENGGDRTILRSAEDKAIADATGARGTPAPTRTKHKKGK